jgi:hypothetical protein
MAFLSRSGSNAVMFLVLSCVACGQGQRRDVDRRTSKSDVVNVEPSEIMDLADNELSKTPCIGDLREWNRLYYYAVPYPDEKTKPQLHFVFREAGVHGFVSGRQFVSMGDAVTLDDRAYKVAMGSVDSSTGKPKLEMCGSNAG